MEVSDPRLMNKDAGFRGWKKRTSRERERERSHGGERDARGKIREKRDLVA